MKNNSALYDRLSILAALVFIVLVVLQINWLVNAAKSQVAIKEQNFELLAPDIALKVNAIDHDAFHVNRDSLDTFPDSMITDVVVQSLIEKNVYDKIAFAIYADSSKHIYQTNMPEVSKDLLETSAKACLSCIVSFSTISADKKEALDRDLTSREELFKSSTFQYYSPVFNENNRSDKLWFSLYQPNLLKATLRDMLSLFLINIMLLVVLLALFYFLLRALTKYKRLTQVKEDFFNNMTHEFKTPLSSIRLASRVLLKRPDEEKQLSYLQLIDKESQALEHHIDKILELSLLDNDKLEINRSVVNLCDLIRKVPMGIQPLIEKKNAVIHLPICTESIEIFGDPFHLKNAFTNLVENSLKYGPESVEVNIHIRRYEDRIVIDIRDDGPGILPEHQPHVFERFYRSQRNNQYKGNGFGIGLSYVQTIVNNHGGTITLDTSYEQGTAFQIIFNNL